MSVLKRVVMAAIPDFYTAENSLMNHTMRNSMNHYATGLQNRSGPSHYSSFVMKYPVRRNGGLYHGLR